MPWGPHGRLTSHGRQMPREQCPAWVQRRPRGFSASQHTDPMEWGAPDSPVTPDVPAHVNSALSTLNRISYRVTHQESCHCLGSGSSPFPIFLNFYEALTQLMTSYYN